MTARTLLGALVLAGLACGEPERNDPAPPSLSAGSVTIGGGGASTATTADATDDPTSGGSDTTVSTSMPTTTASTADSLGETGLDTDDPSMPEPPTAGGTAGAVGCEVAGEACEGDGICVLEIVPGGVQVTCSHGTAGEPCSLDSDCVSQMCVSEVTGRAVVRTCT